MYAARAETILNNTSIDLRSDTVTKPTPEMRELMASASVGDDVYGDDPTVNKLEETVAELMGKEAALFVSSGTQSNLIAVMSHCGRGDEYISGANYHVPYYEAAGAAVLGGISPLHLTTGTRHELTPDQVRNAIKADDVHHAVTRLVSLENTVYGLVQDPENHAEIAGVARDHGLKMHLDGARLMNAVVKSNRSAKEISADFDTVSLCLSKGLGAPVGSVLSGPADFIKTARRNRKMLGGGMRQAGVLAACGLYALENNVARLADDHARARTLAEHMNQYEELGVDMEKVETNMVFLTPDDAHFEPFKEHLAENGIIMSGKKPTMRIVIHLDIGDDEIVRICDAVTGYFS